MSAGDTVENKIGAVPALLVLIESQMINYIIIIIYFKMNAICFSTNDAETTGYP